MSDATPEQRQSPHSVLFADALEALDQYLSSLPITVERLKRAQLQTEYRNRQLLYGWRISARFSDGVDRRLDILLDAAFPFLPPRIALVDRPSFLTWPHVERDGVLCLLRDNQAVDYSAPAAVLEHLLGLAMSLVEDCVAGRNVGDLLAECRSYWSHATTDYAPTVWSLLDLQPPSRLIVVWASGKYVVAADSRPALAHWVKNFRGNTDVTARDFVDGLFVWLPASLYPSQFPRTGTDVRELLRDCDGVALEKFESLVDPDTRRLYVLLGAPTQNGVFVGAVLVEKPRSTGYGASRGGNLRGFRQNRPDRIPRDVVLRSFFGAQPVTRAEVERIDAPWVHGRESDDRVARLVSASVAVIGCGSLGSGVAVTLAQAGVGDLLLIDPERLSPANISRHALGQQYVGQNKATALSHHLRSNFPHIKSVTALACSWQRLREDELQEVARRDLIICAIGNIGIERAIDTWARRTRPDRRVVYGWLEPFACAAHAVAIIGKGGCLECGLDRLGDPVLVATEWPGVQTTRREPGCGAVFQPYGAVELLSGVATVAELALDCLLGEVSESTHRVHVTSQRRLQKHGGTWSAQWQSLPLRPEGDLVFDRRWEQSSTCRQCNNKPTQT